MDKEKFFRHVGTHPAYWYHYARTLKRASELLWAASDVAIDKYKAAAFAVGEREWINVAAAGDFDIQLGDPSILLLAASIENLLKGTMVALGARAVQVEKLGHKLNELFQMAGLKPTGRQTWLLNNLQEAIEWRTKYPAPKSSKRTPEVYWTLEREHYPELLALWDVCAKALDDAWLSNRRA